MVEKSICTGAMSEMFKNIDALNRDGPLVVEPVIVCD